MKACVTGATGFVGGHVVRELTEAGHEVRVTFRDERRLERLATLQPDPVKADVLDRARDAPCRARVRAPLPLRPGRWPRIPAERVWQVNALAPRIAVEAAAAEGVARVVVTSSVAGIGPAPPGEVGTEDDPYRGGGPRPHVRRLQARGRVGGARRGARLGVDVVVVNPSYVLGVRRRPLAAGRDLNPHDRQLPARPAAGRRRRPYRHRRRRATWRAGTCAPPNVDPPGERYVLGGAEICAGSS